MSSTTQDYDATKDASSYEQRGVQKYDGAGDHDGKRWHVCKDEIKSALETWSRRAKKIVTGQQESITAANVVFEGHIMFDDMRDVMIGPVLHRSHLCCVGSHFTHLSHLGFILGYTILTRTSNCLSLSIFLCNTYMKRLSGLAHHVTDQLLH